MGRTYWTKRPNVNIPALLDPARFAAAWASIANAPPSIPSETDYRMRLISKWTRDGKVPTLEEAEALEGMEYARDAVPCLDYDDDLRDGFALKYGAL